MTYLTVKCDMTKACREPVTMIDAKGFAYCATHGLERRAYVNCRRLHPAELRKLERGEALARY